MARSNKNLLDAQINKLQTELTKTQVTKSDAETDYAKKIEELEDMIDSMQAEMDESVEEKEKEIEQLKRGVDLKDDMISQLVKEKEQLVLSMTDMMTSRRDEIDELQAELMEMSTRAADQVREVQNLKLQLADTGYRREEMDKMRCQLQEMREQVSERDDSRMDEKAELEMENNGLRQKLRQVSLERQAGEDKLREFIANHASSKTVQVLRERNATLKLEVEKMSKKLKKMAVHMERQQKQSTASQSVGSMRVAI
jgi:chromosome segregation ATPase